MFESLKQQAAESKLGETQEDLRERAKAQTLFAAISSAQDKTIMTDIETDNEYLTAAEDESGGLSHLQNV